MQYKVSLTNINPALTLPRLISTPCSEEVVINVLETWLSEDFQYLKLFYAESRMALVTKDHKKDYFLEVFEVDQEDNNS